MASGGKGKVGLVLYILYIFMFFMTTLVKIDEANAKSGSMLKLMSHTLKCPNIKS